MIIERFFDNIDHDWLMKMLELRIKDKPFLGLIRKWLKSGILKTTGDVTHPETGCPQGAVVSSVLANIYLHHVLDFWFEKAVKEQSRGDAYLCRMADDFICAFRYKEDADRFYQALPGRLMKFGLELTKEKTRIVSFSRFRKHEKTSFDFLEFEYRWSVTKNGKDSITRRTSRSKFRKSVRAFTLWCKENRDKRLKTIVRELNIKLRGYFNYYGVMVNYEGIQAFYTAARRILYKWLNRRSQRRSFTWEEFTAKMKWYGLMKPRITEVPDNQLRLEFCVT